MAQTNRVSFENVPPAQGEPKRLSYRDSIYGIGVDDREEGVDDLFKRDSPANRSMDLDDKVDKLLAHVEQLQVTSRDNTAILHQMMGNLEERMDLKIAHVRREMLDLIQSGSVVATQGKPAVRRVSTLEVRDRMDKYNSNGNGAAGGGNPGAVPGASVGVVTSHDTFYDMVTITPFPGFVVKTRQLLGDKNKVFINIFHHDLIALEPPGMDSAKATDKPYMMMDEPQTTEDRAGNVCIMYNVGISSEYFVQPNPKVDIIITAPSTIYKIIHKVNLKFSEFLDEGNYSIPRLANGYKGEVVPDFTVPLLKGSKKPEDFKPPTRTAGSDLGKVWGAADAFAVDESHRHHRRDGSQGGEGSVVSDLTGVTGTSRRSGASRRGSVGAAAAGGSNGKLLPRKSFLASATMGYTGGSIAGRNLLSGTMLEFYEMENVSQEDADRLKGESADDPTVLLGWQIWLVEGEETKNLYVVTDVRKNLMGKTEFRLSRFKFEDTWVKLRRRDGGGGSEFRPMRKVLHGLQIDDETVA